jgi:hypothetical protein
LGRSSIHTILSGEATLLFPFWQHPTNESSLTASTLTIFLALAQVLPSQGPKPFVKSMSIVILRLRVTGSRRLREDRKPWGARARGGIRSNCVCLDLVVVIAMPSLLDATLLTVLNLLSYVFSACSGLTLYSLSCICSEFFALTFHVHFTCDVLPLAIICFGCLALRALM